MSTVYEKMKAICDNIRLRTGGTELLTLDDIAQAILTIGGNVDIKEWVHKAIGTTFPPTQLPAETGISGSDIDIMNSTSDDVYSYIDAIANNYPNYATKESLGKDTSNNYDMVRYTLANRQHFAWQKENYPKMYAWKSDSEGEVVPNFTNIKDQCIYKYNQRYSLSSAKWTTLASSYNITSLLVPVPAGKTNVTIRLKGVTPHTSYTAVYGGASAEVFTASVTEGNEFSDANYPSDNGIYTIPCTKDVDMTYISFNLQGTTEDDFTDIIVTVDEPIEYVIVGGETIYSTSVSPRIGDCMYLNGNTNEKYGAKEENVTIPAKAVIIRGYRYSHSGQSWSALSTCASLVFPIEFFYEGEGINKPVIQLGNAQFHGSYTGVYIGDTNTKFARTGGYTNKSDDAKSCTLNSSGTVDIGKKYIIMFLKRDNSETFTNTTVTIDGVSLDVIVTDNTADSSLATHSTTQESSGEIVEYKITDVSATNRSRTINNIEFMRYEDGDVEPTVIYTDVGDSRNSNATITQNGVTYNRYPLGDLLFNQVKPTPIFIYANEHGVELAGLDSTSDRYQKFETKMCSLIASRFIRDLCIGANLGNAFYKYIRENCMLIVIPVANPFGFNMNVTGITNTQRNGYLNVNNCNINRNYDCPGWDVMNPSGTLKEFGAYVGSENETQYIMNTMVESKSVVAMSLHGLGGWEGLVAHQGQSPDGSDYNRDKLELVNKFLQNNYGYTLRYYDIEENGTPKVAVNTPDITSKSPSFITQCGAYGGIVEFSPDDVKTSGWKQEMKSNVIENAYAQMLNLMAMWLSDYLEN